MTQVCESWESDNIFPSDSRAGLNHTVSLTGPDGVSSCSCEAYQFKGKCKHIDAVKAMLCLWDERIGPEAQQVPNRCPRCDGQAVSLGDRFEGVVF